MLLANAVKRISEGEPDWLRNFRLDSLRSFHSLPWQKSESAIPEREGMAGDKDMKHVPSAEGNGITCENIFPALQKYPYLRGYFRQEQHKTAALQAAIFNSGFFLLIPEDAEATISLKDRIGDRAFSRGIIIAGENSRLNLVQDVASSGEIGGMLLDIHAKNSAQVNFSFLQNMDKAATAMITARAALDKNAGMRWTTCTLGGKLVKGRREIFLQGEGAEASDLEIIYGNNSQEFELHTNIYHTAPNTKGYSTTKGVLGGSSRALTQGLAKIEKSAPGSDSYLAEHMLLVDKRAKAEPMPFMEIDTNDVKARHSGFVSQIDAEKIFYLRSRGIGENEARKFVALGFLETSMQQVDPIREQLRNLLEAKWGEGAANA